MSKTKEEKEKELFNIINEIEQKNNIQHNNISINDNNINLLSKDNFHNDILPKYDNSVDLYYSHFYKCTESKEKYNILMQDLKLVLKNNIISKDINQNEIYDVYDKIAKQHTTYTLNDNIYNKNNYGRLLKQGQQLASAFTESIPLCILKNFNYYKSEPFGPNTSPDIFIKYKEHIFLIEMKAVQCVFNNKHKLLCNFNNATNSIPNVQEELNNYMLYNGDTDKFITENIILKREIFEELTVFVYYYVDTENNKVYFFDCDIIPMPLALAMKFNKDGTINRDANNGMDSKSNGENSINNNACISLLLKSGFNNEYNKLIDRLWLYLYNKTFDGKSHLINSEQYKQIKKEKQQEQYLNEYNENIQYLINNLNKFELKEQLIKKYNNIISLSRKLKNNKKFNKDIYINNKKQIQKMINKYKKVKI